MNLNNKTILITGASSGIGYELALQLSEYNCNLILTARRKELLDELSRRISSKCKVISYQSDVSDKTSVKNVYEKVIGEFGKIDIAILNAGIDQKTRITNFNSGDAEITMGVNFFGLVYWIELLLPEFMREKRGMIVGVTSLADVKGFPGSGYYCASKAAAGHLLESLRIGLKKYNVKVITVKPGFVKTPMTDKNEFHMPFLIDVDKAVKIIIRGIEKEKRVIEFPLMTSLSTKLLKCMPYSMFEFIFSKDVKKK
ncbi:MAG: SDR family NAD(P)-dependent oxidoreductase [Ignavibacteriaceae bacterium]|nr:SDR family NAD(P)-dependent oxidoreductase [Ignavibacteriaceae bacterium]